MPGDQESAVSVIVAAGRGTVRPTLDSIRAQDLPGCRFEIIVVADETAAQDVADDPSVRLIRCETRNPAVKRNRGAREAAAPVLAFLDDDATAPPDWLARGLAVLEAHPEIAGVGGPNLPPDDAGPAERLTDLVLNAPLIGAGSPTYSAREVQRPARIGELHLVNLFIRRAVWDAVGGLNEAIGYGCEDSEFIYQAQRTGAAFRYDSDLVVRHARRPFGWPYVRQRFMLRTNNGRLMWVYPCLYLRRPSFLAVWAALAACILLAVFLPFGLAAAAGVYVVALLAYNVAAHPRWFPLLAGALVVHHVTYASGLMWGVIVGAVTPWRTARLRRRSR